MHVLAKQSVSETTRKLMCGFSRHQGVQEWPTCFCLAKHLTYSFCLLL